MAGHCALCARRRRSSRSRSSRGDSRRGADGDQSMSMSSSSSRVQGSRGPDRVRCDSETRHHVIIGFLFANLIYYQSVKTSWPKC
eukprot:1157207-Pelagomonas_calceolata.AAC.3